MALQAVADGASESKAANVFAGSAKAEDLGHAMELSISPLKSFQEIIAYSASESEPREGWLFHVGQVLGALIEHHEAGMQATLRRQGESV